MKYFSDLYEFAETLGYSWNHAINILEHIFPHSDSGNILTIYENIWFDYGYNSDAIYIISEYYKIYGETELLRD